MANNVNYSQSALDNLEQSQSDLESSLQEAPSSSSSSLNTNPKDVQTEIKLRSVQTALDKMQAKKINEQWYGKGQGAQADSSAGTTKNPIFQGLDALARPLYAVAGVAKYLAGDKSKGFLETVNKNMTTDKTTFGDILTQKGAPKAIAAPIGFALDVAFDPVNWLTMGSAAFIPKVAKGLVKGAAGDAIKEGALKTAVSASKFIPGVSQDFILKTADSALKAGEAYNTKTGRNVIDIVSKRAQKASVGDYLQTAVGSLPGGDWVIKNFSYSPEEWYRVAKIKDQVETAAKGRGGVLEPMFNPASGLMESPTPTSLKNIMEEMPVGEAGALADDAPIQKMSDMVNKPLSEHDALFNQEAKIVKEGVDLSDKYAHLARSTDSVERMTRMLGEANIEATHRDVVKALNELSGTGTSLNKYDKMISGIRGTKIGNVEVGKKLLDGYTNFIGIFKSAKIGFLSPASVTNAVIGNTAMLHMTGADITRLEYLQNIKKAWSFVRGKESADFFEKGLLDSPEWQDFITKNPGIFKKTYGFGGDKVLAAKSFIDEAMAKAPQLASGDKYEAAEIKKAIDDIFSHKQKELAMSSPLKYSSGVKASERGTDVASQELTDSSFLKLKEDLLANAEGRPTDSQVQILKDKGLTGEALTAEYNKLIPSPIKQKASQALHWALTKPSESYSQIDQANKLGAALTWVKDGVTEKELMRMTNSVIPGTRGAIAIDAKDIMDKYAKNGKYYYRLTPDKATEIANLTFMNYAAMPAAVKVLRSIPILGSPFMSFSYAMAAKMGQTALSNPAAYNKITLGLHEFSGNKTPLEKEALKTPYYNFYNSQGMVKLPFFKENPLYLNVANMIPYYNMNMFAPSERKYKDSLGDALVSILDKTPILKDPVGQTIFDYFIQPMIIKDSLPQGSFGQVLYPTGTNALGKVGYATKAIAEAPLPSAVATLAPITPGGALDYVPSYRWRQLGYALQGKSPLGAPAKEPASSRTLRALGSTVGLSTQPLDLTYAASNTKK